MAQPQKRVSPSVDARDEDEGSITTMTDVDGSLPEVVVGEVQDTQPQRPNGPPMAVIRVNTDIEEMTYVAGGRRESYTFVVGNRYRVPVYIAQELENTGKLWH